MSGSVRATGLFLVLLGVGCGSATETSPRSHADEEWRSYSGDVGSTKYSSLAQIDIDNVAQLSVVWSWESADYRPAEGAPESFVNPVLQATPLKIGDRLYTTTNQGRAAALDPGTGEELWVFDPATYNWTGSSTRANRGPGFWTDGSERRLLFISGERLVAVNADTGIPLSGFGDGGAVDLADDPDPRVTRYLGTSAPLVVGDIVIVGSTFLAENRNWQRAPPGYVRAFDVQTGELRWRFNPIPGPGEPGAESWLEGSNEYTGDANAWTAASADPELGLVYLPLKTTTNDWYGGHRPGNNLYGESLVAVDADTGERVWHFQMVHHGLWDYDPPAEIGRAHV